MRTRSQSRQSKERPRVKQTNKWEESAQSKKRSRSEQSDESLAKKPKKDESETKFNFSVSCFNVANLGGKWRYPEKRDQEIIDQLAKAIFEGGADVVNILEVLKKEHKGVQELSRLEKALGKLTENEDYEYKCGFDLEAAKRGEVHYTGGAAGETYGILLKRNKGDQTQVAAPEFAKGFEKRAPALYWVPVGSNQEIVGVVAYHAPSASAQNERAREKDFNRLIEYCGELREKYPRKAIVLASDLNIDTLGDNADNIEHMSKALSKNGFFNQLTGRENTLGQSRLTKVATSLKLSAVKDHTADYDSELFEASRKLYEEFAEADQKAQLIKDTVMPYLGSEMFSMGSRAFDKVLQISQNSNEFSVKMVSEDVTQLPEMMGLFDEFAKEKPSREEQKAILTEANKCSDHTQVIATFEVTSESPQCQAIHAWRCGPRGPSPNFAASASAAADESDVEMSGDDAEMDDHNDSVGFGLGG